MTTRFRSAAHLDSSSTSATFVARGFSTKTCLPASMTCFRCCNHHAINPGIIQNSLMRLNCTAKEKICLHKLTAFWARIRHVLDHAATQGREVAQEVWAPVAAPDLGKY